MQCNTILTDKDVEILGSNSREDHLFTLEAYFQFELKPVII